MQDKEFLADVERTRLTVSPMKGEDLQQLVKQGERVAAATVGQGPTSLHSQSALIAGVLSASQCSHPLGVMAGLVPAIHVLDETHEVRRSLPAT